MLTDVDEFYHPGVGSHCIAKQEAWSDCFLCDELDHITVEWLKLKRGGTARCSMMHTVREQLLPLEEGHFEECSDPLHGLVGANSLFRLP